LSDENAVEDETRATWAEQEAFNTALDEAPGT
jgi:hypothetical protein